MKPLRFFLPRMEYILLMALFWSVAASGPRILNFDGDLPRHLLLGNLIRATRSVPLTDTFSFRTEGYASIPHEWLSQVIFSFFYDLLGLGGVVLLTALLVTGTWGVVLYETQRRTTNLFATLFIAALGIAACMIHVLPRPHLFTYLFTAIWIMVLERVTDRKPLSWWLLPVLMVIWVNLHGMFVLGIILWGIYLTGSFLEAPSRAWFTQASTRSLLAGGAVSLFATLLSPSGIDIWEAVTSLGSNSYITARIPEYQSANFHLPETWPFILLLLITVTAFARNHRRISWKDILLTTLFTGIALYTSRMLPLFAIVVVPSAVQTVGEWIEHEYAGGAFLKIEKNLATINSSSNGLVWLIVLSITVVFIFRSGKAIDPQNKGNVFEQAFFPVLAVDWLNQNPQQGHMFNEFDWGGYLLLQLAPRQQIFMDGHTHIYGEELTREYETVITLGNGWQNIFDKYDIEWAIVRQGSPVSQALLTNQWEILYKDQTTIILRR